MLHIPPPQRQEFKAENKKGYEEHELLLRFSLVFDYFFWAILPAININLHSKEFEFEWLFFGLYIRRIRSSAKQ